MDRSIWAIVLVQNELKLQTVSGPVRDEHHIFKPFFLVRKGYLPCFKHTRPEFYLKHVVGCGMFIVLNTDCNRSGFADVKVLLVALCLTARTENVER